MPLAPVTIYLHICIYLYYLMLENKFLASRLSYALPNIIHLDLFVCPKLEQSPPSPPKTSRKDQLMCLEMPRGVAPGPTNSTISFAAAGASDSAAPGTHEWPWLWGLAFGARRAGVPHPICQVYR